MIKQTNRTTDYYITVEFTNPNNNETEEVDVYPSYDLFMKSLIEYVNKYHYVKINGSNNSVWNFFVALSEKVGTDLIQELLDDENFYTLLKENYMNSYEYDDDQNEWFNQLVDEEEF